MLKYLLFWLDVRLGLGARERGASLIEYVLIIAVIAIAIFVGASAGLGDAIGQVFTDAITALQGGGE